MSKSFYDRFHKKNDQVQLRVIDSKNYTYQAILKLSEKYLLEPGVLTDFGCGVGTVDLFLSRKMKKVIGLDISELAIKNAFESAKTLNITNVKFRLKDLSNSSLSPKTSNDYVICSEVFEHIEDDKKLLREIFRSMKKGAIGIFSVPSLNAPLYKWRLLEEFDNEVGHLRRYNTDSFKKLMSTQKLEVLEVVQTEGLLRNLMYTKKPFGFLLKFVRGPIIYPVNWIDNLLVRIFGESNIFVVVRK